MQYDIVFLCKSIQIMHNNYICTILVEGWIKRNNSACISHVAQVSDTAQVTRQISLLGLIENKAGNY